MAEAVPFLFTNIPLLLEIYSEETGGTDFEQGIISLRKSLDLGIGGWQVLSY